MLEDPQYLATIIRLATAAAFAIAGCALLWQSRFHSGHRAATTKRGVKWPRRQPTAQLKRPQQPLAIRLLPGAELGRLSAVIDAARTRVQVINSSQVSAAVQIDAAEIALNRLLAEIGGIMPAVIKPTMVPRRAFDVDNVDIIERPAALAA